MEKTCKLCEQGNQAHQAPDNPDEFYHFGEYGPVKCSVRSKAKGALTGEHPLAAGTEIEKTNSEPGDGHSDGSRGKVVSALGPFDAPGVTSRYGYFILWEDFPVPVFTVSDKVKPVTVH